MQPGADYINLAYPLQKEGLKMANKKTEEQILDGNKQDDALVKTIPVKTRFSKEEDMESIQLVSVYELKKLGWG